MSEKKKQVGVDSEQNLQRCLFVDLRPSPSRNLSNGNHVSMNAPAKLVPWFAGLNVTTLKFSLGKCHHTIMASGCEGEMN